MLAEGNLLESIGYFFRQMIATRNLTFMLMIGIGMLTIALLVLTRTRWGQAKPVSKCIALSILAHLLLGGYAWGTKLMFSVPTVENDHPTSVTLISDAPESTETVASQKELTELQPWEKYDTTKTPVDSTETVQRPEFSEQYQVEKANVVHQKLEVVQPPIRKQNLEVDDSQKALPIRREPHKIVASNTQAETINLNRRREPTQTNQPLNPNTKQPERLIASSADIESKPIEKRQNDELIDIQGRVDQVRHDATGVATTQSNPFDPVKHRIQQARVDTGQMVPLDKIAPAPTKRFDGAAMPDLYRLRTAENRLDTVKKLGGSKKTEAAVNAALKWLAANQQQDGRWNPRHSGGGQENLVLGHNRQGAGTNADTGITGLAVLSFLGAGHTQHEGPYRDNIARGLQFLTSKQKQNGSLAGDSRLFAQMYCHSMALFALAEAYAITGDKSLKSAVEKGVAYSLHSQNKAGGGWRYQPGDAGDMSQFGWQVMALKAAKLGGIEVPDRAFQRMNHFLQRCSSGNHRGLAAYRPVERVSHTMTAEALVCRYFLQEKVDVQTAQEAANYIQGALPTGDKVNYYYWYYGTLAMHHTGGKPWRTWNDELSTILVRSQNQRAAAKGSWDPNGLWCGYGGRVYSTAMATLCLEVYYRYLTSLK